MDFHLKGCILLDINFMNTFLNHLWKNKLSFFITFFVVFTLTYLVFVAVDFLPEELTQEQVDSSAEDVSAEKGVAALETEEEASLPIQETTNQATVRAGAEMPLSISIAKLDKTIDVMNPMSRTIADLDTALLDGVVRHPDSATLAQEGNVFILGHSSYLPNVFNKNFQAFNGIQNLEWGDIIEVASVDTVYEYRVEKVYRARAQDVTVPIADTGNMLTLATCNSFGSVDDRYIVEANQTGSRAI
jgi:LPXTG-site transpeptidase (sortase) family protein